MSLFIADAMAAGTQAPTPDNGMFSFVMIGVIFVLFYFMLIRPQNRRAKEHRNLISQLKKGDEVITSGGLLGKIENVTDENYLKIMIGNGIEVSIQRSAVSMVLPKGTLKAL